MQFTMAGHRAEYDLTTNTFTRWELDGETIAETRPMTDDEIRFAKPLAADIPTLMQQVNQLTAAVDQLVIDSLMAGM